MHDQGDQASSGKTFGAAVRKKRLKFTNKRIEKLRASRNPAMNYAGLFRVSIETDESGKQKVLVHEHYIPTIGMVFKRSDKTGEVLIDRYAELRAQQRNGHTTVNQAGSKPEIKYKRGCN